MKKALMRFAVGLVVGIFIGDMIALIVNIGLSRGDYMPVMPSLQSYCATELNAVLVQTFLTGMIGVVFAEAGFLFTIDRWSFLKQCVVHFFVTVIFYVPFISICWFPLRWESVGGALLSGLVTYIITYFVNYKICCRDVRQINELVTSVRGKNTKGEQDA